MGRSQESFNKKEVRRKKEKKRKEKEQKRLEKKEGEKGNLDDMIAYVDQNGVITSTPPDPDEKEEIKAEDILVSVPNRSKEDEPDPIRKGTLTFFNDAKGYGFIEDSETKERIFVHINNMLEEIDEGDIVRFEIETGPKGLVAVNVTLLK
ncbi:MAG: cold shock domain-containing protein [Bacteroidales bacterium]|jgi:cold shock CspA family protein|nr:cold shock domain-containing protein [Bacteroidales bacterium]